MAAMMAVSPPSMAQAAPSTTAATETEAEIQAAATASTPPAEDGSAVAAVDSALGATPRCAAVS